MYKFGKTPPRSLHLPGVASVLAGNCRVYYDNLFSTTHLGRVSDLLAARLREQGLDELRLRAVLLFSFFQAYRAKEGDTALEEPLTLECGLDGEKVAVGISFDLRDPSVDVSDKLIERVSTNHPEGAFEALLALVYAHSDHTMLRWGEMSEAGGRKVELLSLLAIPGKMEVPEKQPLTVVRSEPSTSDDQASTVRAEEYIQLGDLDYKELLKPEKANRAKEGYSTGEFQVKSQSKDQAKANPLVRIEGTPQEQTEAVRISSVTEHIEDKVFHLGADKKDVGSSKKIVVSEGEPKKSSVQAVLGKVWPFNRKDKAEQKASEQARKEGNEGPDVSAAQGKTPVSASTPEPETEKKESQDHEPDTRKRESAEQPPAPVEDYGEWGETEPVPTFEDDDPKAMVQYVLSDLTSGSFARMVERVQNRARDFKREPVSAALQTWMEGLSQEIMFEKVRLMDVVRKISQSTKQMELELKQGERTFAENLRRKDEEIRKQAVLFEQSKERLVQLAKSQEQQNDTKKAVEDAALKKKYQLAQKIIAGLRDENKKLGEKNDDLKSQMSELPGPKKGADPALQSELTALKTSHEQLLRQYSQVKTVNEQLLRRIQQNTEKKTAEKAGKLKAATIASEEAKRKIDNAVKVTNAQQKELEMLHKKVEQLKQDETRLKGELVKKEAELRSKDSEMKNLKMALEMAQRMLAQSRKAG